jgi:TRAP-type C4-dicarboxylate transport system permease small subunit
MPVSRPRARLLPQQMREWLEAFAAALCLAAIIALLHRAGVDPIP